MFRFHQSRSFVVLCLPILMLFAASWAAGAVDDSDDPVAEFKVLATDEPVSTMAMTEDGLYLVLAHQAADSISVWDVKAGKTIKSVDVTAPRALLCRGGDVYVANDGKGTITVLDGKKDWKIARKISIERPNIVHLSAPHEKYFKDELIVTCHEQGQYSQVNSYIYRADTRKSESELISRSPLATVSYDGKVIITQDSFNQSPSGQIAAFAYQDFVRSNAKPLNGGGIQQTPYVYQEHRGSYWIGPDVILGGNPIAAVKQIGGNFIFIPDLSCRQVYALNDASITARRLDTDLTPILSRKVLFPPAQAKDFARVFHQLYRHRGYKLDHPVAYTHGKDLYLFLIDVGSNAVLYAHTPALGKTDG
jgi:hypothetical protein